MNVSISEQDIDYAELRNDIRNYIAFRKKSWNVETKSLEEQRTTLTTLLQDLIKIILKTNYSCYDLVLAKKVYENLKDLIDDFLVSSVPPKKCDYVKEGWTNWLTVERKNAYSWKYSNRYFQYLAGQKGWSLQSITSLNFTTDDILSHCGDPNSPFDFCVKGLVIGDIQSGKTGNYTSLINKAIDAGYKFIIVLTGTTNDLRAQTQKRLEKEVVGVQTNVSNQTDSSFVSNKLCGVSDYDKEVTPPGMITSSSQNGDISSSFNSYPFSKDGPACLAIIKKNPSSLKKVISFINSAIATQCDPDLKMPFPVLMIDDEADLASVNTNKKNDLESSTGTNRLIRKILFKKCRKFTYVGYTATPFANIFIAPHDKNIDQDDADDIFPDDFIINLDTPDGYSGIKDYFGITNESYYDDSKVNKELLIPVDERELGSFTNYDPSDPFCEEVPESLREALMCFLISTGAKISRGIIENYTMLINVDVHVSFNSSLKENVSIVFNQMCKQFQFDPMIRQRFKQYWENVFVGVSKSRLKDSFRDHWDGENGIEQGILKAIEWKTSDSVKLIVGSRGVSPDTLDYSQTEHGIYICVGGLKLSRGLTLEGLSVSYYGRRTSTIDTLMQMGRWFGYRKGWIDLCRVFTSEEITNNYLTSAIVLENLKKQIEDMNGCKGATPRRYGLMVKSAEALLPTSRTKSRNAIEKKIGFSASLSQTLEFSKKNKDKNFSLINDFIVSLLKESKNKFRRKNENYVFKNIPVSKVISLLKSVRFPSSLVNQWIDYVERANKYGEMEDWSIIVSTNKSHNIDKDSQFEFVAGLKIVKPKRSTSLISNNTLDVLNIRALTSPSDYLGHFEDGQEPDGTKYDWLNDEVLKNNYSPKNGILVIYVFDIMDRNTNTIVDGGQSTVGLAIWFPKSLHVFDDYAYLNPIEAERQEDEQNE